MISNWRSRGGRPSAVSRRIPAHDSSMDIVKCKMHNFSDSNAAGTTDLQPNVLQRMAIRGSLIAILASQRGKIQCRRNRPERMRYLGQPRCCSLPPWATGKSDPAPNLVFGHPLAVLD